MCAKKRGAHTISTASFTAVTSIYMYLYIYIYIYIYIYTIHVDSHLLPHLGGVAVHKKQSVYNTYEDVKDVDTNHPATFVPGTVTMYIYIYIYIYIIYI